MSLSKNQISIVCVVVAAIILAVTLGCLFGIKCTVTLNFGRTVRVYDYDFLGASSKEEVKVIRFSNFLPPTSLRSAGNTAERFVGWYKDYSCTVPWLSTDKVTSNITLYAKWESIS